MSKIMSQYAIYFNNFSVISIFILIIETHFLE